MGDKIMSTRRASVIALMILVGLFPITGFNRCSRSPTPPTGSYPTKVGNLALLHPDDVRGVQEAGYKHFQFDYGYRESDHFTDVVQYHLRVYPSPTEANSALETERQQRNNQNDHASWEDRFDKSGQKLGRMLLVLEGQKTGCTIEYAQGANLIIILGSSCDDAKDFQKNLPVF
jgi:hypothetical protein